MKMKMMRTAVLRHPPLQELITEDAVEVRRFGGYSVSSDFACATSSACI
jgi:hypothetical protein